MVGSDIGDINSPTHVGSRSTRVDPKLFGKPSDFSGDRREWRHFEWVFRNWFGFLYDTAEDWLDQAACATGELGEAVPDRRETDKALYMSLAMVCKNEALDVVKTVTHKRGFEIWRKLSKEYGATTGTSLHEYTNLLEYDFGTTDGFKKRLLKWENQIVDFQKATGEVFSDRLMCNCFHALQEIELFLTSLLFVRHSHVLVSLEETFRRRLRAVTHFMSLLES